jgi:hypothetical protein
VAASSFEPIRPLPYLSAPCCCVSVPPSGPPGLSSRADRRSPHGHHPGRSGFTRLSTTAFGSWCAGKAHGSACSHARFPAIVEAASRLKASSFLIDGEAVVCRNDGVSDFDALRSRRRDNDVTLIAFDLIELQGDNLRDVPLLDRKRRLAKLLGNKDAIRFNEHLTHDGPAVFECRLGLEGIVFKRIDSPYRSGPSKVWLNRKIRLARPRGASARKIGDSQSHSGSVRPVGSQWPVSAPPSGCLHYIPNGPGSVCKNRHDEARIFVA